MIPSLSSDPVGSEGARATTRPYWGSGVDEELLVLNRIMLIALAKLFVAWDSNAIGSN
ncbi:hypothetical protein CBM2626_B110326 [Cupriavidus taiwanensis]|uniref:Uncharacterized protein n=1 Tax=Cupriavidus taiwanensis TaxID=164546 RepID=A0A976B000_9BURK|nr:hypothetical protein CBM2614_B150067 [Cupriavidus taiwanensis]SOZ64224.1 hypothetical protein CBM2615_B140126 [Cupriavidus taiwanensis]SOZ67993.1 hypothetical protein CBM2613_B110126 [Cupriavidus taiwanensis]SPA01384.1 hypothetical protein CBM2626_B110326 [Cupriavidus taiwanensis]SPA07851.1 hypothetical protein CBM2625_B110126 [Cupriavidus taiwanensis]